MKRKITHVLTGSCLALAMLFQANATLANTTGEDEPKKEATAAAKATASRNNSSVKIYPDILKRVMHVVAKDNNEGQGLDFFVFDLQGTLVQHYKMKSGDHEKITGLKRGKYVFRVFAGDEETATGNFEMR